ncbi:MAG TPA: glycosyltransferase family 1 protein [Steroidobacteraceae bacterium]|nr:glycosyltransferase family 1 protein [Steroidobacteraceae bacterium]
MRIALATDAWAPQTNGVVTTLKATAATLTSLGHQVRILSPQGLPCFPCPSYPEIRLAVSPGAHVAQQLRAFRPHAIHIATEGPLGLAVRGFCRARHVPFTTSYHTRYPEYLRARWPIPLAVSYAWLRNFHGAALRTFVSSATLEAQLSGRGFRRLHLWRRGVDLGMFCPRAAHPQLAALARPIMACVGRLAVEKNLAAFLELDVPGTKVVIGDGPERGALSARYADVVFTGYRFGEELAALLSGADVLVFPSLTDTFGLAMIEALACGVPVAAFPVPGPVDVIEQGVTGVLHEDLRVAIASALRLDRRVCAARAAAFSWDAASAQFLAGLALIPLATRARLAVGRSSAMIARSTVRRPSSEARDPN